LKGTRAGGPFTREIPVTFSPSSPPFDALAGFWARRRIDDLMSQDWLGLQQGAMKPALREQITQLGLDYRLMTQFTSFVAVEDRIVIKDGKPQRMEVPVEIPEGVNRDTVFGERQYDYYGGQAGRISGGVVSKSMPTATARAALAAPVPAPGPPPPPPPAQAQRAATLDEKNAVLPAAVPLTKERQLLESKFQPAVLAALDCAAKKSGSCANVHAGKIALEIWLTEDSPAVRAQLKALGFDLKQDHPATKMLTGTLAVDKLETLAKLTAIRFVSLPRR
jgi:Ca-activated chloride channel homolog